ncbi:hypothetical protein HCU40_04520 [Pseudanabaena biceps]|nr:hypothetical protein [Pseudanabaena biceps]
MVPINRRKVSLYEEAKNGLSSLVWQTATVFVGFIFMLLLTGGNPSSFAITLSFVLGIAFVAWREQNRFTKLRKAPLIVPNELYGSLGTINRRTRPQKKDKDISIDVDFGVAQSLNLDLSNLYFKDSGITFGGSQLTIPSTVFPKPTPLINALPRQVLEQELLSCSQQTQFLLRQAQEQLQLSQLVIQHQETLTQTLQARVDQLERELQDVYSSSEELRDRLKRQQNHTSQLKAALLRMIDTTSSFKDISDKNEAEALRYLEATAEISLPHNETSQTLRSK